MHILRSAWAVLLLGVAAVAGAAQPPEAFWHGEDAGGDARHRSDEVVEELEEEPEDGDVEQDVHQIDDSPP